MSDTKIDDGGSAFPVAGHCVDASGAYCGDVVNSKGLSLRDWFAGQALAGLSQSHQMLLSDHQLLAEFGTDGIDRLQASKAFRLADAMLAAKKERV